MRRLPLIVVLILCATVSFGQSKKKRSKKSAPVQQQGNSLGPYFPAENYEPEKGKSKKSKSRKPTRNAVEEFYERKELVAKARKKAEKESMKPQYSDPLYFGHKRKPKKRPPGKMKFCKECEIRH